MSVIPATRGNRVVPVAAALAFGLLIVVFAGGIARGSLLRDVMIVALLLSPLAISFALARPLAFPYCVYIVLLPFDMFLGTSRGGTVTKLIGVASGLLLLFYCLRTKRFVQPHLPLYILGAFIAWMAISLLWAVDPGSAVEPLQTLFGLMLLYAALSLAPIALSDFYIILAAIVFGYLAVTCYGIATFHGIFPGNLMHSTDNSDRLILAVGSHYIDPNEFADALVFPVAVAMMLAFRTTYLSLKFLYYAIVGAMVAAIALSGSREAVIALAVVLAYYIWRSRYRVQLYLLIVLMAVVAMPLLGTLSDRFQTALATGGAGRTSIWAVGLVAVKHYGLFGSGIGSFPIVYDRFYISVPQTYLYGWGAPPHNVPLRYWVELGVVGLALVVLFVAAHFVVLRSIKRDHPLYDFRLMMEAGLLGICVSALFIDSFHDKWTWLVFATAVQLANLSSTYKRRACTPSTPQDFATGRALGPDPSRARALPAPPSR